MKNNLTKWLVLICTFLFLLILVFVIYSLVKDYIGIIDPQKKKEEQTEKTYPVGQQIPIEDIKIPPKPPRNLGKPERILQNLQTGKTYKTHLKGTLNVRARDKDWGLESIITINFGFEAIVDRKIISNDGKIIIEERDFKSVKSLKIDSKFEDLKINLGKELDPFIDALKMLDPGNGFAAEAIKMAIDGASLKPIITGLSWLGIDKDKILTDYVTKSKAFYTVDTLNGKSVRLTYEDGKGVIEVAPLKGEMLSSEKDFHFASVLISDSLIFPDTEIKIGNQWAVDGSNFGNLVDPGLKARVSGEVMMKREDDQIVGNKNCKAVKLISGRLLFDDSNNNTGKIGHFDPVGSMFYSPESSIFIKGELKGKSVFEHFSKNHLLFEARMTASPELRIIYTCEIVETNK